MTQWLISFIFHLFLKDFPLFSSESCFSDFPHFQVLQWLCFLCHILLCRNWLVIERKTGSLRARVPQTLKCVHTWVGTACQHPARVIWSLCGNKLDDSIYRILGIQERNWTVYTLKGDWGGKGHSGQWTTPTQQQSLWTKTAGTTYGVTPVSPSHQLEEHSSRAKPWGTCTALTSHVGARQKVGHSDSWFQRAQALREAPQRGGYRLQRGRPTMRKKP